MELVDVVNDTGTQIAKDLKINLERLTTDGNLTQQEAYLTLLSLGASLDFKKLVQVSQEKLRTFDFNDEQIREAQESAAIMAMLNMYYRFKHMLKDGQGAEAEERYKQTGLRMMSLGKPVLGKQTFEMMSFAVSVLNGCESCINAHEIALRGLGVEANKIHDLARLAAVVKGLKTLEDLSK